MKPNSLRHHDLSKWTSSPIPQSPHTHSASFIFDIIHVYNAAIIIASATLILRGEVASGSVCRAPRHSRPSCGARRSVPCADKVMSPSAWDRFVPEPRNAYSLSGPDLTVHVFTPRNCAAGSRPALIGRPTDDRPGVGPGGYKQRQSASETWQCYGIGRCTRGD